MDFDPFVRGPHPVGVRTAQLTRAERELAVELWYPAAPLYFGQDISPITQDRFAVLPNTPLLPQAAVRDAAIQRGRYPLVVYSHTSLGHRRQSTFLTTHLASHGFVVAAVDHAGNTFADLVERARAGLSLDAGARAALIERIIGDRIPDLQFVCDAVLHSDLGPHVDPARQGLVGWSFGGWAVLAAPEVDARFSAVVALVPGGNRNPLPGIIPAQLTFEWQREVATLYLAAERDRYIPLAGIQESFERTPSATKYLFVLGHADHDHFGDTFEPELIPRQQAHLFTRALTLAHLRAALADDAAAQHFLDGDALAALRDRGVTLSQVSR